MVNCLLLVCSLSMAVLVVATFGAGVALFRAALRGELDVRNKTSPHLDLALPDTTDNLDTDPPIDTSTESMMNATANKLMEEPNAISIEDNLNDTLVKENHNDTSIEENRNDTSIEENRNDTSIEEKLNDTLTEDILNDTLTEENSNDTSTEQMMDTSKETSIPAKENLKVPMLRWEHPSLEWKEPVELKDASLEFKDSSLEWKDSQGKPMKWNRPVGFG